MHGMTGRKRPRPGGPVCSPTLKAICVFLVVSLSWGCFVITRVARGNSGVEDARTMNARLMDAGSSSAGAPERRLAPAPPPKEVTFNEVPQDDRFHLVFSTDCSGFQNWQSMALFFSADAVGQPGILTRIASGCSEAQKDALADEYGKLDPRFNIHFTPDFKKDSKTGKRYDFYNKPYGLLHWLQSINGPPKDSIIALLDPDFIFLRPLTYRIREDHVLYSPTITTDDLYDEVVEGKPAAQHYGIGSHWTKFNVPYIAGASSPALKVSNSDAYRNFSVGPPYIVHQRDMRRIAEKWVEFVPKVYEEYPELLAEMYAYSIAAAHLELPHLRLDHYMVSNTDSAGEGWPYVDRITDRMCGDGHRDLGLDQPVFLHYCQFYRVEHWGFHKRRVDENLFSCDSPLFKVPPEDLEDTHWKEDPYKKTILSRKQAKRSAFQLCELVKRLNQAATKYKSMYCAPGTGNFTRDVVIW